MVTASLEPGVGRRPDVGGLSERQVHIVRSAYRLFADRGVERVPIHEIASAAGVSKGIVLYYFKTKEQLVGAAMSWVLEEIGDRIRDAVAGAPSPVDAVATMIETIFLGPDQSRRFYLTYLDLIDHAARVSGFGQISAAFRASVNRVYAEVIRSGVAAGTFQVRDVDEAAVAVRAIVEGLHFQWLQEDDWREQHAWYKRACTDTVLAYLLNAGTPPRGTQPPPATRPPACLVQTVSLHSSVGRPEKCRSIAAPVRARKDRRGTVAYVIARGCVDTKDQTCIDCAACVDPCSADAIFAQADLPEGWAAHLEINALLPAG